MPALTATTRFFQRGTTKVYFLPTIAAVNLTPTRPEITAGTDLSAEIADLAGWAVGVDMVDVPDLGSRFTAQIAGSIKPEQSSITFYGDVGGADARTNLPVDQAGFIVFMDGGDVPTKKLDAYPVKVASHSKLRTLTNAFQITISFSITKVPGENLTIPA